MKVCHTQAIKMIKELEEQKSRLIMKEDEVCIISYKEGETKIPTDYDYKKMRAEIRALDEKIRKIKTKLALANSTVKVDGFDITIGEALVFLAQLQNERSQVESLSRRRQISRRITANGVLEYTECNYDVNEALNDSQSIRDTISELQIAIDRANLINYIEV